MGGAMSQGTKWAVEDEVYLLYLWDSTKVPIKVIAKRFNRTELATKQHLMKLLEARRK